MIQQLLSGIPKDLSSQVWRQVLNNAIPDPTESKNGQPSEFDRYTASTLASAKAMQDVREQIATEAAAGQLAGLGEKAKAYALQVPQQEEMPSQGQYPRFQAPETPQRGRADSDPQAKLLAGLASALAPGQFRGDILASPIQGALEHANQVYEDKIKQYKMNYETAQRQHEDDLAAREEEAKRSAYNATVKFKNELGSYEKNFDFLMNVESVLADLNAKDAASRGPRGSNALSRIAAEAEVQPKLAKEKMDIQMDVGKAKASLLEKQYGAESRYYNTLARNEERLAQEKLRGENALNLEDARQVGRREIQAPALSAAETRARIMAGAGITRSKIGAGATLGAARIGADSRMDVARQHADAVMAVARLKAETPSKSQSGELKSAQTLYNQSLKTLRAFEAKNPLDERLQEGESAHALRYQWNQLQKDVLAAKEAVIRARAATPQPSRPIGGPMPVVVKVKTLADAMKLKPGTHFLDPDGVERIR